MNNKRYHGAFDKKKRTSPAKKIIIVILVLALLGALIFGGWTILKKLKNEAKDNNPVVPQASISDAETDDENQGLDNNVFSLSDAQFKVKKEVTAKNVLVYDLKSHEIIGERGSDEKVYPASLTKILAAIVILENTTNDDEFVVGNELSFVQPNSSTANLKKGYILSREQIIDAILIMSGNDASYTAALHVGKKAGGDNVKSDLDALHYFVKLMNDKAKEIGANNTHFLNPDGYHEEDHYTTPKDLLLMTKEALKIDLIKNSVAKPQTEHILISGQPLVFKNTNFLMYPGQYYYEGTTGMKTGTTNQAGNCLIATAERNGKSVIVITMGSPTMEERWTDAISVLNDSFAVAK